jgi:Flp pilus assembly protein TadD
MKKYSLGFMLLLAAAPAFSAQIPPASSDAQILYLQHVDAAIREGRLTQAEQMIAFLEQSGDTVFADDLLLLKAEHAIALMDATSASMALAKIQNEDRNICRMQAAKGWVAASQKAYDTAIAALDISTKNCPEDAGAWNLFGLALVGKGAGGAARDAFARAMALEPGNAQVINNYALATLQDGNVDAALRELNGAVMQSPEDQLIRANRNYVAGMAGLTPVRAEGESDAAWSAKLVQFAQGAKIASRGAQATALFSRAMLTLERFDEAIWSELSTAKESNR